jgi:hypothetical protein
VLSRMRSLLRVIVYCSRRRQDVVAREYNVYVYIYITLIYIYICYISYIYNFVATDKTLLHISIGICV